MRRLLRALPWLLVVVGLSSSLHLYRMMSERASERDTVLTVMQACASGVPIPLAPEVHLVCRLVRTQGS
jgi:hypothetical protein